MTSPHLPLANVVRGHDKPMGLSWVMPSPMLQDEIERTTGKSYAQSCIQGPTSGVSVRYTAGTSHSSFEKMIFLLLKVGYVSFWEGIIQKSSQVL